MTAKNQNMKHIQWVRPIKKNYSYCIVSQDFTSKKYSANFFSIERYKTHSNEKLHISSQADSEQETTQSFQIYIHPQIN